MRPIRFYAADCDPEGGVYLFSLTDKGVKREGFAPLDRPMYLNFHGGFCRAVLRAPFGTKESGVATLRVEPDGALSPVGGIEPTHGAVGCHLTATDAGVYVVNYTSGSVCKLPDTVDRHEGRGADPARQSAPHTHCVIETPDGRALAVTDLGTDEIYLYDHDLRELSRACLPPGSGPRHLAFSADGKRAYCSCELSSEVAVLSYENGRLSYLFSVSTLPEGFSGENTTAAVRVREPYLYVSNRGHDSIACFRLEGRTPVPLAVVPTGGASPWDFDLWKDNLVCANYKSGDLTFFTVKDGVPSPTGERVALRAPLCVSIIKE